MHIHTSSRPRRPDTSGMLPDSGAGRRQVPERGLFAWLGRVVTAHPVRVALGWVFIVAALAVIGGALGQAPASSAGAGQLPAGYESARAEAAMDQAFGAPSSDATAVVVISRTDGRRLTGRDLAIADHAIAGLTGLEARRQATGRPTQAQPVAVQVGSVAQPSPNHEIVLVPVSFGGQSGAPGTDQAVANVRSDIGAALAGSGLRAQVTGLAAAAADSAVTEGLATYGMLAAILILLLLLFRSPGLPFIVVGTVFGVGTGVTSLLTIASHLFGFQIDQTTTSLLPVVLFGVGTDYAVFLLYRYRGRLSAGDDHRTAMAAAIGRVGHAMVASALAVAVSFTAMLASGLTTFRVLGPSLAIAVLAMLLTSLTLLPAMLAIGSRRRARSKRWTCAHRSQVTGRVAGLVARWPAPVAAGAVTVLAVLAVGALHYHASYDQQIYPSGSQSAAGYEELQRGYPAGALEPTQVIITADHAAPTAAQLTSFAADLGRVPGVGLVTLDRTAGHGRFIQLDLQLSADPLGSAAFRAVRTIEAVARTRAPAGTTALVGGDTAAYDDLSTVVGHDMKIIFALAGAAILLILLIMLRSLLAPLYLMASVVLGFAATLGASVVVFQGILGYQGIDFQLPMIVYLFVASIGTDYNILIISRLREEMRQGAASRPATATAIRMAGPAVAAAGLVLSASFAMLMISPQIADIGFAVAAGVLISAFINAFLLVPALTMLAGRTAWWPAAPATAH
jgi:putative drug exporter of the RND superfamily